jgi:pimeloyl-ACP methyl ester carboxylesterase
VSAPPDLPGVTHRYVDAGGLRVHVAEAGDPEAPPVVLLHGWPQHWWMWRKVIAPLAGEHRVLCPDLRGHGWTDAPSHGYDKEQFATDLLATLDALDLERVCLAGHDWGGWTGFLACLRAPERFERFLALGIPHLWQRPSPESLLYLWRLSYQVVIGAPVLGPAFLRTLPGFVRRGIRNDGPDPSAWTEADLRLYSDRLQEPDRARASSLVYRTFLTRELPAIAAGRYRDKRLTVPGVLLVGEDDPVVRPQTLAGLEEHADDFRVEVADRCGHFFVEERPQLVVDRALELFSRATA